MVMNKYIHKKNLIFFLKSLCPWLNISFYVLWVYNFLWGDYRMIIEGNLVRYLKA